MIDGIHETLSLSYVSAKSSGVRLGIPRTSTYTIMNTRAAAESTAAKATNKSITRERGFLLYEIIRCLKVTLLIGLISSITAEVLLSAMLFTPTLYSLH